MVKNLPANAGDMSLILGWKDSLEKEMTTHSSILACEIPWTEESGRVQPTGSQVPFIGLRELFLLLHIKSFTNCHCLVVM